jgi:hypothetical protein
VTDEELFKAVREQASLLQDPDKKQLQFNTIVETAKEFYLDPLEGIKELVSSCSKSSPLYIHKKPMAETLQKEYQWLSPKN